MIGVDLDNTIVCYDRVFDRLAEEHGVTVDPRKTRKTALRDHFRSLGQETRWTELQGIAYGPRIGDAVPFPGVLEFFSRSHERGTPVAVISHRTRFPYLGERHDLHEAARTWLDRQGFHAPDGIALSPDRVFLEATLEAKLARIAAAGCTHFIDDLPEVLAHPLFPAGVQRILFDPHRMHAPPAGGWAAASWEEIERLLSREAPS